MDLGQQEVEAITAAFFLIFLIIFTVSIIPFFDSVKYEIEVTGQSINQFDVSPSKTNLQNMYAPKIFESRTGTKRVNISIIHSETQNILKSKLVYFEGSEVRGDIKLSEKGPITIDIEYQRYNNGEWETVDSSDDELPYQ